MCIASKRLNELNNLLKGIESDYGILSKQLSKYDKEVSEIYHKIEVEKFDAARGYCLAKELQIKLRERRVLKHEIARLDSISKTLNTNHLHNAINKSNQNIQKLRQKNKKYTEEWKINTQFIDELVLH